LEKAQGKKRDPLRTDEKRGKKKGTPAKKKKRKKSQKLLPHRRNIASGKEKDEKKNFKEGATVFRTWVAGGFGRQGGCFGGL